MAVIERNSLAAWCDSFLRVLSQGSGENDPTTWIQPESIRRAMDQLTQAVRGTAPQNPHERGAKAAPTSTHSC
jgi:hypothetical protein